MNRIGDINGAGLVEADLAKYPSIPLATITADPNGVSKIMSALNWLDEQLAPHM